MKNMKTLALLSMLAVAAGNSAQAQTVRKVTPAGQDYTINNITPASGSSVTYQWFRDGAVIANATSASYTVPANLAKHENGLNVANTFGTRFQRAAYGIDCPGGMAMSNEIIVYFCELMVNSVCWARANVSADGRICSNPWDLGGFYQWNRPSAGYNPTSPAAGVAVNNWNATLDPAATWTNGFPCPIGWRLPTELEIRNVLAMSHPIGGVWVEGGVRGVPAGTNGRLLGYNTEYCTMSNMNGCTFLPAQGYRTGSNGALTNAGVQGRYWSSEQTTAIMASHLLVISAYSTFSTLNKDIALSIRCVQDVQ